MCAKNLPIACSWRCSPYITVFPRTALTRPPWMNKHLLGTPGVDLVYAPPWIYSDPPAPTPGLLAQHESWRLLTLPYLVAQLPPTSCSQRGTQCGPGSSPNVWTQIKCYSAGFPRDCPEGLNNITQKFGGTNAPYLVKSRYSWNVCWIMNEWGKKKSVYGWDCSWKSKQGTRSWGITYAEHRDLDFFPRGYKESMKILADGWNKWMFILEILLLKKSRIWMEEGELLTAGKITLRWLQWMKVKRDNEPYLS